MVLTRDDMLRELELLPVWRTKYIEPVQGQAIEAKSAIVQQEVALVESTQIPVVEDVAVPAVEAEISVVIPTAETLNAEVSEAMGDACVVCPLHSLTQRAEAASVPFLLVGFSPDMPTIHLAELYAGEQGELLSNMLAAIKFKLVADDFIAFNQRQVQQATLMLVLGELAAQSLLASKAPIDELRGKVHVAQGVSVVVTYQPTHLLQYPKDKAKAWQDLLLAKKVWADLQSLTLPSS